MKAASRWARTRSPHVLGPQTPASSPQVKWYGIRTCAKGKRVLQLADGTVIEFYMPDFAIKGGDAATSTSTQPPAGLHATSCCRVSMSSTGRPGLHPPPSPMWLQSVTCVTAAAPPGPAPTLAGVVYQERPRAQAVGTARIIDKTNRLEAVLTFGPVKDSKHAVMRRADAVSGEIYQYPSHAKVSVRALVARSHGGAARGLGAPSCLQRAARKRGVGWDGMGWAASLPPGACACVSSPLLPCSPDSLAPLPSLPLRTRRCRTGTC